jgi:hypothetical protein
MAYVSVDLEIQAVIRMRDPYLEGDKIAFRIAHTKHLKSYYRRAIREHPNRTKDW